MCSQTDDPSQNDGPTTGKQPGMAILRDIAAVLWPEGNPDHPWDSDTMSQIATILADAGFGAGGEVLDPSTYNSDVALEDAIYLHQWEQIKAQHGLEAAEAANYGWGVAPNGDGVSVATKVYGHGVIQTDAEFKDGWS